MIIISPVLDSFFRFRLKNPSYRARVFRQAMNKELRSGKTGVIILRNLGELMAMNPAYHKEFAQMFGEEDYQKNFWESDLGYLWYQGNLNAQNKYFEFALSEIKANGIRSVLDVGCGWGRFCNEVVQSGIENCKGIDISADIISQAKSNFPNSKAVFEHKDIREENSRYDLITLFGSADYIPPADYEKVLEHILTHTNKEVIIVNSLRGIPLEKALRLEEAMEIKRYDDGYLQPTDHLLKGLQKKYIFDFNSQKAGTDSLMTIIHMER